MTISDNQFEDLKELIVTTSSNTESNLKQYVDDLGKDLRTEMKVGFQSVRSDMKVGFDGVADSLETLNDLIDAKPY